MIKVSGNEVRPMIWSQIMEVHFSMCKRCVSEVFGSEWILAKCLEVNGLLN